VRSDRSNESASAFDEGAKYNGIAIARRTIKLSLPPQLTKGSFLAALVIQTYRAILSLAVRAVIFVGIRPNTLTAVSLVFAIVSGAAAAAGSFKLSSAAFLLSGLCDLLDGPTARAMGESNRFGALLDSTIDRISDAGPFVGLVIFYSGTGWPAVVPCLTILSAFTVSYIRARAESLDVILPFLWMRRAERLLLTCFILILGDVDIPGVQLPAPVVLIGIGIVGALSVGGAITAMRSAQGLMK
jgi:CDP-diacylglycerol--glycerol-3-phosphate 3-phosphatidyltransferase